MTPADLAAALGVDVESVKLDAWGDPVCETNGVRWAVDSSHVPDYYDTITCSDDSDDLLVRVPITTTLTAAVTRVRRMLEIS